MSAIRPTPGPSLLLHGRLTSSMDRAARRASIGARANPFDELDERGFDSFVDDITSKLKSALNGEPVHVTSEDVENEEEDVFGRVVHANDEQPASKPMEVTSSSPGRSVLTEEPLFAPPSETTGDEADRRGASSESSEADELLDDIESESQQAKGGSEEDDEAESYIEEDEGDDQFVHEDDDEEADQLAHVTGGLNTPSDDADYSADEEAEEAGEYASRLHRYEDEFADLERQPDGPQPQQYLPSPALSDPHVERFERTSEAVPSRLSRAMDVTGDEEEGSHMAEEEEEWFGQGAGSADEHPEALHDVEDDEDELEESEVSSVGPRIPYHLKGKAKAAESSESDSGESVDSLSINLLLEMDGRQLRNLLERLEDSHERAEVARDRAAEDFFRRQVEKLKQAMLLNDSSDVGSDADLPHGQKGSNVIGKRPLEEEEDDDDDEEDEEEEDDDGDEEDDESDSEDEIGRAIEWVDDELTVDLELVRSWPLANVAELAGRLDLGRAQASKDPKTSPSVSASLEHWQDRVNALLREKMDEEATDGEEVEAPELSSESSEQEEGEIDDDADRALGTLAEELVRRAERRDERPVEVSAQAFRSRRASSERDDLSQAGREQSSTAGEIVLSSDEDEEDDEDGAEEDGLGGEEPVDQFEVGHEDNDERLEEHEIMPVARTPSPPVIHDVVEAGRWDPSTPIAFGATGAADSTASNAGAVSTLDAALMSAVAAQAEAYDAGHAEPVLEAGARSNVQHNEAMDNIDPALQELIDTTLASKESELVEMLSRPIPPTSVAPPAAPDVPNQTQQSQEHHVHIDSRVTVIADSQDGDELERSIEIDELSDTHRISDAEGVHTGEVLTSSRGSSLVRDDHLSFEEVRESSVVPESDVGERGEQPEDETSEAARVAALAEQGVRHDKTVSSAEAALLPTPIATATQAKLPDYVQPEGPVEEPAISEPKAASPAVHSAESIRVSPPALRRSVTIEIEEHHSDVEGQLRQVDAVEHDDEDEDRGSRAPISSENAEADLIDVHLIDHEVELPVPDEDHELPSEDEVLPAYARVPAKIATPPLDKPRSSSSASKRLSPSAAAKARSSPVRSAASLPAVREESPDPIDSFEVSDPANAQRTRSREEEALVVEKRMPSDGADYEAPASPVKESPLLVVDDDDESDRIIAIEHADMTPLPPPRSLPADTAPVSASDKPALTRSSTATSIEAVESVPPPTYVPAPNDADDELSEQDVSGMPSSSLPPALPVPVPVEPLVAPGTDAMIPPVADATQDPGVVGDEESNGEETTEEFAEDEDDDDRSRASTPTGPFSRPRGSDPLDEEARSESPMFDEELPSAEAVPDTSMPAPSQMTMRSGTTLADKVDKDADVSNSEEQELLATLQPVPRTAPVIGEDDGVVSESAHEDDEIATQPRETPVPEDTEQVEAPPSSPRRSSRLRSYTPSLSQADATTSTPRSLRKNASAQSLSEREERDFAKESTVEEEGADETPSASQLARRASRRAAGLKPEQVADSDEGETAGVGASQSKRARSPSPVGLKEEETTPTASPKKRRRKRGRKSRGEDIGTSPVNETVAAATNNQPQRGRHAHVHSSRRDRRPSTPAASASPSAPVTRSHCEPVRLEIRTKGDNQSRSAPYVFVVPLCALSTEDAQETMAEYGVRNLGPAGAIEQIEAHHVGGDGLNSIILGDDTVEDGIEDEDVAHAIRRIVGNDLWHEGSVELLPRESNDTVEVVEEDDKRPESRQRKGKRRSPRKRGRESGGQNTPSKRAK